MPEEGDINDYLAELDSEEEEEDIEEGEEGESESEEENQQEIEGEESSPVLRHRNSLQSQPN